MTGEQERMARAGDYVLGLMSEDERERAERDMERDTAFRLAVLSAAQNFHKLDLTAKPEPVPADLWARVLEKIAQLPQMSASAQMMSRSGGLVSKPAGPLSRLLAASRANWRGYAVAASLLAACAVGYFGASMLSASQQPVVVVVLDTSDNIPGAIFEAYADDTLRIVPLKDFVVPEGRTMQVWTLYDREVGPVSLGTLGRKVSELRLTGPSQPRPKPDQLYEITLEPEPGSPTGKPTGPILVKGFARQVAGG